MTRTRATCLVAMTMTAGCAGSVRMAIAPEPLAECRAADPASASPALTWIRPTGSREQRALDARCAQVGRPIMPQLAAIPHAPRLLVATWNVHDGRGDVLGFVEALRRGTPAAPAPDAIVVLLQEVVRPLPPLDRRAAAVHVRPTAVRDIPSIVSTLGWHLAYLPARRNRLRPVGAAAADRGVAILSSLPLDDLEAIELPVERQRRVALSAVVSGTAGAGVPWRLRIVNVHLENRAGARRLFVRAAASRTRQTEALLHALTVSPTATSRLPLLVGGDFNFWLGPRETALRLLRDQVGSFSLEDVRPTMDNSWRLDYLFPRLPPSVRATQRRLDSTFGSDHYPVAAMLDFSGY